MENRAFASYKYRGEDTRLGRFFAVDPLTGKYPWNSPYAFSENRVIDGFELEGREVRIYTESSDYLKINVGHTFLTVGDGDDLIVYTYGRYDDVDKNKGSLNGTNFEGEGVLIRLTGEKANNFVRKYIITCSSF